MNNIEELIEIIKELGGSAAIGDIAGAIQKKYRMVIFSSHIKTIEATLLSHIDLIRYENGVFFLENSNKSNNSNIRKLDVHSSSEKTLKDIFDDSLSGYSDIVFDSRRKEIRCKSIQMMQRRIGFCVYFNNSHIHEQSQLDYLIDSYKVYVHYGNARKYQKITWDVSRCVTVNNTDLSDLVYGYFGCEGLSAEAAEDVYRYLLEINSYE